MSGKTGIKTAAVILDYNDDRNTLRLCESFCTCADIDFTVVVDNSPVSSLDGTKKPFVSPKAELIKAENKGYAAGNNKGIRFVAEKFGLPDYFIISNPDVDVECGSIHECVRFLENNKQYAAAAPHMLRADGTPHRLTGWRERSFLCDLAYSSGLLSRTVGMCRECYPKEHWQSAFSDVDCLAGSFFVIRGEIFSKLDFFDENTFLYYEEDILGFRLKKLGSKLAVLNNIVFIHREEASVSRSVTKLQKYKAMQRSRIYFQKAYRKIGPLKLTLLYLATCLGFTEKALKAILSLAKNNIQPDT